MPLERRSGILRKLNKESYCTGTALAEEFGVTRQVIVKDIAILRAEGHDIIATPRGYFMSRPDAGNTKVARLIASRHGGEEIDRELEIIVDNGGRIVDVIVEHPVYGEIRANLMIDSRADLRDFLEKLRKENAKPLSSLTEGIHIHTVQADNEAVMERILRELSAAGFLVN